ncbi:PiggyBac transposable element-derived protein 4 [Cucumispora dikerogammari]|nr:PiggyBac transposable element-derived protein 4 [Cucumispora dikerogammari]
MVPYCFKSAPGIKVKIPKTVEGFIELFFTEKLINFIHKLTLKKQLEKNKKNKIPSTQVTVQDMKTFLSIYMQLGIKNVSNFALCWRKSKKFVYNSLIAGLLSLERFTEIDKMITMISKKDIVSYKLKRDCKTILYIESLFAGIYEPREHISIDEGMMAFKERIKNRVYSPLKSDKWGMKFYVCAESTIGYVLNMRICE